MTARQVDSRWRTHELAAGDGAPLRKVAEELTAAGLHAAAADAAAQAQRCAQPPK
ncbi:hypothetical protein [Mycobacterium tilburgii]|uniref:hypothetical protein n=1 Tax=Mycobacterium tilburgii TaxID=44467 RepID=UPI0021B43FEB|nr:hypothetical protein [Mycobacterium tilburgii]